MNKVVVDTTRGSSEHALKDHAKPPGESRRPSRRRRFQVEVIQVLAPSSGRLFNKLLVLPQKATSASPPSTFELRLRRPN